ncbi:MAG: hypothetical protein OXL39_09450 [Caldilineaceae bacterium]|nr:hypothetical protein [Caldilineaceae bacterium]
MDERALSLDEFITESQFWGKWEVSYTDGSHLPVNEYIRLGDFTIDASKEEAQIYPILPFEFRTVTDQEITCQFSEIARCHFAVTDKDKKAAQQNQVNRAADLIRDLLAESMVRTGLVRPKLCLMEDQKIEMDFVEVMKRLSNSNYLLFVVDTGALRRATASFLHLELSSVPIWVVVPVFVMNEVQRGVEDIKNLWGGTGRGLQPELKNCEVLRKRPQVSCVSQELNHLRMWRPVEMLTTLREHLGRSNGQSRVDRLIIESAKNLKRDRGLHRGVYLLTGDKDMASLATLENQGSLHVDVPPLPSTISSVRYNSQSSKFVLTPIHNLLWDLALIFSKIRLVNKEDCRIYELDYYSKGRGGFIAHNVMEIRAL